MTRMNIISTYMYLYMNAHVYMHTHTHRYLLIYKRNGQLFAMKTYLSDAIGYKNTLNLFPFLS